tara:strand:- start:9053 stop:9502 length:450 start_codon:yes stop_codon:yes gene_type:complete
MKKSINKTISALTLLSIIMSSIFVSCENENKVENKRKEVFAIHDEIMPEMGNLMKLKRETKAKIHLLDSLGIDAKVDELNTIIQRLDEADEAMMEWMRNFKDPTEETSETEALDYLEEELKKIKEVKKKFNSSSKQAMKELSIKTTTND